jgi:hypothetical protein
MRDTVEIENIEALRIREGIYDVDLRQDIRVLRVGDSVYLTFRNSDVSSAGETLRVRITSIRGGNIRGRLTDEPTSAGLSALRAGTLVGFTSSHIHSLPKAPQQAKAH